MLPMPKLWPCGAKAIGRAVRDPEVITHDICEQILNDAISTGESNCGNAFTGPNCSPCQIAHVDGGFLLLNREHVLCSFPEAILLPLPTTTLVAPVSVAPRQGYLFLGEGGARCAEKSL